MVSAAVSSTDSRRIIAAAHVGFVLTGVVTTLLGPILPALASRWHLDDQQAGYLFTAQFLGSICGATIVGRLIARFGYVRLLVLGFLLMSAGTAALGIASWGPGIASVYCYGLALGLVIPGTNLLIAQINPASGAAALNLLNFAWCVGAVVSPPVLGPIAVHNGTAAPLGGLALLILALALWLARLRSAGAAGRRNEASRDRARREGTDARLFIVLAAAICFLYVGAETSVGGWLASYALRNSDRSAALWSLAPATFWGGLLLGRLTAPLSLNRIAGEKLTLIGAIVATAGIAVILSTTAGSGLLAGAAITGAGFASVFPNTIATFSEHLGGVASRRAGILFVMGGLGGATIPWTVGVLSDRFASLRAGLLVALCSSLGIVLLQIGINLVRRGSNPVARPSNQSLANKSQVLPPVL